VCCSVAVCCSVLQCVAVSCNELQCVAVWQCVAVCCKSRHTVCTVAIRHDTHIDMSNVAYECVMTHV